MSTDLPASTHIASGHLQILDLRGTKVTDAGLVHLKSFSKLESLDLTDTKVTEKGVTNFKEVLPSCNIWH